MTEGKEREPNDKIRGRRAPRGWAWYISRARAIAQYCLVDVSERAREAGIGCPVALTSTAWQDCVWVEGRDPAIETQRLRHLLDSLRAALPPLDGEWEHVNFPVEVADIRAGTTRVFHLDAFAGTGDDGEPVISIKLPCECYFWEENLPLARRIHDALAVNERPDDEGIVACLLETPEHHAALRHAVRVDGATVEHLAAALWCGRRLQTLISSTNPHRVVFRDMAEDDSGC
jgi:Family of unknown function (DUF6573)